MGKWNEEQFDKWLAERLRNTNMELPKSLEKRIEELLYAMENNGDNKKIEKKT